MRNKAVLVIEAVDIQMVADIVLSHDPSAEIVKGKLGKANYLVICIFQVALALALIFKK